MQPRRGARARLRRCPGVVPFRPRGNSRGAHSPPFTHPKSALWRVSQLLRGGGPWGGRRRHWAVPEGTAHVGLAQNRVSWERRVWGRGPRSPRRAGPGHLHMGLRTLRGARKRAGAWGVTVSMTQDCVGQLGPAVSPGPRRPPCVHMHNLGDGQRRGRHGPRGRPPTPSREPCLLAPSPAQSRWARGPEESSARAESRAVTEAGRTGWVRLSKSPHPLSPEAGRARRDRDPGGTGTPCAAEGSKRVSRQGRSGDAAEARRPEGKLLPPAPAPLRPAGTLLDVGGGGGRTAPSAGVWPTPSSTNPTPWPAQGPWGTRERPPSTSSRPWGAGRPEGTFEVAWAGGVGALALMLGVGPGSYFKWQRRLLSGRDRPEDGGVGVCRKPRGRAPCPVCGTNRPPSRPGGSLGSRDQTTACPTRGVW